MSTIRPPASRVISRSSTSAISDGRAVARHDDLPPAALQRVEEPQQLALRLAPAREELHVVEQQQVDALVALLERAPPRRRRSRRAAARRSRRAGRYSTLSSGCSCCARRLPIAPMRCVLPSPERAVDEQRVVARRPAIPRRRAPAATASRLAEPTTKLSKRKRASEPASLPAARGGRRESRHSAGAARARRCRAASRRRRARAGRPPRTRARRGS